MNAHASWDWASLAGAMVLVILGAAAQSVCTAWCATAAEQVGVAHAKTTRRDEREFGKTQQRREQERARRRLNGDIFDCGDSEDSEDSEEVWSLQPQSAQKGGTRFDVRPRSLPSCPADKKWSTYAACHFPNRWAKAQQSDPQKARLLREDDHSSSPGPRVMHRSCLSFERTLSTSSDVKSRKGFRRSGSAQSLNSSVSSSSNSADCERLSGATKRKEAKPAAKSSGSRFYADVVSRAQEANRRERSISIP